MNGSVDPSLAFLSFPRLKKEEDYARSHILIGVLEQRLSPVCMYFGLCVFCRSKHFCRCDFVIQQSRCDRVLKENKSVEPFFLSVRLFVCACDGQGHRGVCLSRVVFEKKVFVTFPLCVKGRLLIYFIYHISPVNVLKVVKIRLLTLNVWTSR